MSWSDQDIDKLFKSAKAPEPLFRDEFWTEMEAMLPPAEAAPKRRGAAFWWTSGAAVLLAFAGLAWFLSTGTDATTSQSAAGADAGKALTPPAKNDEENLRVLQAYLKREKYGQSPVDRHTGTTTAAHTSDDVYFLNGMRYLRNRYYNAPCPNGGNRTAESAQPAEPANTTAQRNPEPGNAIVPEAVNIPEAPFFELSLAHRTVGGKTPQHNVSRSLPDPVYPKPERFYVQVAAGIGQSAQRNVPGKSGFLHYYSAGAGLFKRIDNVVLTFGVSGRVDAVGNIVNTQYNENANRVETTYSTLYSLETPASISFENGRNSFGATVTPGFQTGFSGQREEFQDESLVRSERATGKLQNARTLTMEFGINYWRTLQPNWYLGASFNVDALRPFNIGTFAGEQRQMPVNGQVVLRRTF